MSTNTLLFQQMKELEELKTEFRHSILSLQNDMLRLCREKSHEDIIEELITRLALYGSSYTPVINNFTRVFVLPGSDNVKIVITYENINRDFYVTICGTRLDTKNYGENYRYVLQRAEESLRSLIREKELKTGKLIEMEINKI